MKGPSRKSHVAIRRFTYGVAAAALLATGNAYAAALPVLPTPLTPATGATTLNDGATVSYTQNSPAGTVSGTYTASGGVAVPFSCTYDAASRTFSGSSLCGQILGGALTGGLDLTSLEQRIVAARVSVASEVQANVNLRFLTDLTQRRIGLNLASSAQAQMQAGAANAPSTAFGAPSYQSWGFVGGDFVNDDRTGLDKSGHGVVATAGVDHAAGNILLGGYVAYLNSDIDLKSLDGNLSSDGWALGAYATYVLGPVFSISVSGSYGDSTVHLSRAVTTAPVTGRHDHEEWSLSATGNAFWRLNDMLGLSLLAGVDYGHWHDGAYTDTAGIGFAGDGEGDTSAKVGGVLTLWPGHTVQPYVTTTYSRLVSDLRYQTDRDALSVGGGLLFGGGNISGGLEVDTILLQDHQSDTTIGLNIRFRI
jgi:hypothetical protein